MIEYVLIVGGIVMLFVTLLPPTWQVDIGTLVLGALLVYQGVKELNKKNEEKETEET